jgi:LDH2 family malate/lactate/ureidoglycolate dehydrogenase
LAEIEHDDAGERPVGAGHHQRAFCVRAIGAACGGRGAGVNAARSALVDGGNNVGYVAVYRGAEIAVAKAKQTGIAAIGVYNSYFSGRNAYYLERIVNAGLVGLHTASGAPHIVPPGATRPALGINPIAFGFPSADGPVIFDIGTASLMWGEVLLAAETGEGLPPGVAFDADGNPTVDGRAARRSRGARCRITGFCFWLSIPGRFCPGTRSRRRCRD